MAETTTPKKTSTSDEMEKMVITAGNSMHVSDGKGGSKRVGEGAVVELDKKKARALHRAGVVNYPDEK